MTLNLTFVSLFVTSKNPQGNHHPSRCQISGPQSTKPAKMYSSVLIFNLSVRIGLAFLALLLTVFFFFVVFASSLWLSQQSLLCSSKCAQNPDCHCRPSVDRDLWDVTLSGMGGALKKKRAVALHVLPRRLGLPNILASPAAICHVRGLHYVGAYELLCGMVLLCLLTPAAIAFLLFGELGLKAIRTPLFAGDDDPAHDPPLPWQVRALILVW